MSDISFEIDPNKPDVIIVNSNNNIDKLSHFLMTAMGLYPPYSEFTIELSNFVDKKNELIQQLNFKKISYTIGPRLQLFLDDSPSYFEDIAKEPISEEMILSKLESNGFIRKPTENQLKNLTQLCKLRCGANFSVPGSGKTTEALAFYTFNRNNSQSKLLVISPINAFLSWKTEIKKCLNTPKDLTELHCDYSTYKARLKSQENQFFITTYSQMRIENKFEEIQKFLIENPDTFVIVDESHNMKAPLASQFFEKIAPLTRYKLILTGTPMPQSAEDLMSQFSFLYPLERLRKHEDYMDRFQPIYVRTTKKELGLMPLICNPPIRVKPYPAFEHFYQNYIKKPYERGQSLQQIMQVSSFKKAVLKLLNLMSNPLSYIDLISLIDYKLAEQIKQEGYGAKFDTLMQRVSDLVSKGEKVLVWSNFTYSVESISYELKDLGINNVSIKGGIPTHSRESSDYEDDDYDSFLNREDRIKRFLEDQSCKVMVANPASAAESMSLHEVCNHAIYLDRTFNAGQFLQSQDRIHRLIEKERETQKIIEIIQLDTPGSLDFRVSERLNEKIDFMGKFLNDPYLANIEGYALQDEENEFNDLDNNQLFSSNT